MSGLREHDESDFDEENEPQVACYAASSLDSVTRRLAEGVQTRGDGSPAAGSRISDGAWERPEGHAEALPSRDAEHATQSRSRKNTSPSKPPREDARYIICGLTS
jgi:hypothetical protein